MELNTGRALDEACNRYNDVYSDEVLYAAWTETPKIEAVLENIATSTNHELGTTDINGFMARLYACQE